MPTNQTLQIWTGASHSLGFANYMSRVQGNGNAQVCHSLVDSPGSSQLCEDAWTCPEQMDCAVETRPATRPQQAEGSQLGYINGSTGQRFPWQPDFSRYINPVPLNCQHNLSLWLPCLLRTVALYCDPSEASYSVSATAHNSPTNSDESEVTVIARRFRIAPEDAMPSTERAINAGYDMFGSPWIWNLTAQRLSLIHI